MTNFFEISHTEITSTGVNIWRITVNGKTRFNSFGEAKSALAMVETYGETWEIRSQEKFDDFLNDFDRADKMFIELEEIMKPQYKEAA